MCRQHRVNTMFSFDNAVTCVSAARRRVASTKMKRIKQAGSKEQEELEEDNEELFTDIGWHLLLVSYFPFLYFTAIAVVFNFCPLWRVQPWRERQVDRLF